MHTEARDKNVCTWFSPSASEEVSGLGTEFRLPYLYNKHLNLLGHLTELQGSQTELR